MHDEQIYFDEILQTNKRIAESLGPRGAALYTPHADFRFVESASPLLVRSNDSIGLQVADVLAGFCMRYARAVLSGQGTTAEHHVAFTSSLMGVNPNAASGSITSRQLVIGFRCLCPLWVEIDADSPRVGPVIQRDNRRTSLMFE